MKEKLKFYCSIICVIILITISVIIRIPKDEEEYMNSDATYHTLLTMKCYDETPISVHKFLPIVSLGDEEDKNIPWGACVQDKEGNYYYTSFSSAGFVLPYIFVKILNLPINIYSLYAFNTMICIGTLILMIIIFCKLFSKYISKSWIVFFTALIYLFQMEVMHSQGVIFWVQSIFQFLISVQFLLFMNYKNKKAKIVFFVMCVIMPYVEWTGYVSNVAFAIILLIKNIIDNKKITIKSFIEPFIIGILTVLSFVIFSMHFLMNIDFKEYIHTLKNRFFARNLTVSNVGIIDLLKGYNVISYKYMNILCLIILLTILVIKEYRKKMWELIKEYKYVIIFFSFILLENIIMLEHAVTYTFDRLKFTYILLTSFYIMIATLSICGNKERKFIMNAITIVLLIISILNVINYKKGYGSYIIENKHQLNDKMISSYIKENFNYSNSIICSNNSVRGYLNLLFERGIYEHKQYDEGKELLLIKNKKYLVYLNTINEKVIESAVVINSEDNSEYKMYTKNNELMIEKLY